MGNDLCVFLGLWNGFWVFDIFKEFFLLNHAKFSQHRQTSWDQMLVQREKNWFVLFFIFIISTCVRGFCFKWSNWICAEGTWLSRTYYYNLKVPFPKVFTSFFNQLLSIGKSEWIPFGPCIVSPQLFSNILFEFILKL